MNQQLIRKASCIFFILVIPGYGLIDQPDLTGEELTLLKVLSGIHFTFENKANEIWPGYDLSKEPFIAYLPDKWALLLNTDRPLEGFEDYPSDWPDLGMKAMIYNGTYNDLVGQFEFNFPVDTVNTFAMGLPTNLVFSSDNPSYMLLSTTIHEGFHQYQRNNFGEIPWSREEQYPILENENTTLASLEMHILKDALIALFRGEDLQEFLAPFVAVRYFRWNTSDPFVKKYEQGQEINEGTARYVEMKAIDLLLELNPANQYDSLLSDLAGDLRDLSIRELLVGDIESRMSGISVAPEDMLRNRIYPVGAILGYLLDGLKIDWKKKFEKAGPDVAFHQFIIDCFKLDTNDLDHYLDLAKERYDYEKIKVHSVELINEYISSFNKAKEKFNSQPGIKIQVNLPANGLMRFRSSTERKWVIDKGAVILCLHYHLYSLKSVLNENLILEVQNNALLDESDWNNQRKSVTFFIRNISELRLNGDHLDLSENLEREFNDIKISGEEFKVDIEMMGNIRIFDESIEIDFI